MVSDTLESMTRMFHEACAGLGAINEALGLNPDDGGAEPILMAIEALKLRAKYAEAGTPAGYFINDAAEGAPPHFSQITDGSENEPDVFPLFVTAQTVPEGFALVPLQPGQAMCQAGQNKAREWPHFPLRIASIWQAMISAAPTRDDK
jgi:hypothetical protein